VSLLPRLYIYKSAHTKKLVMPIAGTHAVIVTIINNNINAFRLMMS